jgi:seryl-tRNA synthetase
VTEIQNLNAERNNLTKQIATLMASKDTAKANKIKEQVKNSKEKVAKLEKQQIDVEQQLDSIMHSIPNLPQKDVPIGKDEKANVEVRK